MHTRLLVSVRSVAEAEEAIRGGAHLIDVKDPDSGPLGKAADSIIREIVNHCSAVKPVSAAWGEWNDQLQLPEIPVDLTYIKWGLSGIRTRLKLEYSRIYQIARERAVLVCYADAERADSPSLQEVDELVDLAEVPLVLVDTFIKDSRRLTDWIPMPQLAEYVKKWQSRGTAVALAGSLTKEQFPDIIRLRPNWIAVRGAACLGGRTGSVRAELVAGLVSAIEAFVED